jgi:hypothetical protein
MHRTKLSKDELDKMIDILVAKEDILVEETAPTVKGGQPGEKYKAVRAIRERAKSMLQEGSSL